ncbi:hypothetical protein M3Y99_00317800 [Aphelenchoides fujianensis]|nr:hypothetical protein M3Y99_00317800 [Aphelenchoides fujianensis]
MLDNGDHGQPEDSQQILRQIFENLVQSESDDMNVELNDEQQEIQTASPSSQTGTLCNENGNEVTENGRDHRQEALALGGNTMEEMNKQLQFVGHQLVRLLKSLNQAPCPCNGCVHQLKKNTPCTVENTRPASPLRPLARRANNKHPNDFQLEMMNQMVKQLSNGTPTPAPFPSAVELNEDGSLRRGRKSKYCSNEEKKAVAEYAELHGATAAARKFEIPASVGRLLPPEAEEGPREQRDADERRRPFFLKSTNPKLRPMDTENQQRTTNSANPLPFGLFNLNDAPENPPAGRSPGGGFLRGRGRGRPKLIGDELDAELVEHMVQVKHQLPRGHLTASRALEYALEYIREKSPHILKENGGHCHLKITWAMKLVARTNERYRELHGSPPSPIADPLNSINANLNDFFAQISKQVEDQHGEVGGAAEITNERALDFNFPSFRPSSRQSHELLDDEIGFSADEQMAAI